jgi:hypothetical protein
MNLPIGDGAIHLCGAIDSNHFDAQLGVVDDDLYRVTFTTSDLVLVEIQGDTDIEILRDVVVRFFDTAVNPRLLAEAHYIPTQAGHGAFVVRLPAGVYDMAITGRASGDLSGPIAYRVRMSRMPECNGITDPVDHAETSEATNSGIDVDFTADPSFTAATASTPEPTGIDVTPGDKFLVTGMATADDHTPMYQDEDTYELTTDADTNELAVRLDWDGGTADLDYVVFESDAQKPLVTSNLAALNGGELAMFAVKPSTKYWLWIGGVKGSMATAYRATVCGSHFFY